MSMNHSKAQLDPSHPLTWTDNLGIEFMESKDIYKGQIFSISCIAIGISLLGLLCIAVYSWNKKRREKLEANLKVNCSLKSPKVDLAPVQPVKTGLRLQYGLRLQKVVECVLEDKWSAIGWFVCDPLFPADVCLCISRALKVKFVSFFSFLVGLLAAFRGNPSSAVKSALPESSSNPTALKCFGFLGFSNGEKATQRPPLRTAGHMDQEEIQAEGAITETADPNDKLSLSPSQLQTARLDSGRKGSRESIRGPPLHMMAQFVREAFHRDNLLLKSTQRPHPPISKAGTGELSDTKISPACLPPAALSNSSSNSPGQRSRAAHHRATPRRTPPISRGRLNPIGGFRDSSHSYQHLQEVEGPEREVQPVTGDMFKPGVQIAGGAGEGRDGGRGGGGGTCPPAS
ncbi:hypothetical protein JZ751_025884 [Albula glossodonta]|uniref:Uncharacterized protein n=1 Tax=Albula glossodonta TaxID=121402 RepID=A0A8T2NL63_9TELE|nr:hypothetical protein JZ751_025884 [Albula glossodonta]